MRPDQHALLTETHAANAFAFVKPGKMDASNLFCDLARSAAAYALPMFNQSSFELLKASCGVNGRARRAIAALSRAGHAATRRQPDACKQICGGLR